MAEYVPLDTSKIKQSKIRSEKELEKEVNEICKVLKDTTSADWTKRNEWMKTIQSIVVTDRWKQMSYEVYMNKLVRHLTTQLLDLRSSVTREASNTVRIMAQSMEEDFSSLAPKFMHSNSLFKLVSSATKLIAEHGNLCFDQFVPSRFCCNLLIGSWIWRPLSLGLGDTSMKGQQYHIFWFEGHRCLWQ